MGEYIGAIAALIVMLLLNYTAEKVNYKNTLQECKSAYETEIGIVIEQYNSEKIQCKTNFDSLITGDTERVKQCLNDTEDSRDYKKIEAKDRYNNCKETAKSELKAKLAAIKQEIADAKKAKKEAEKEAKEAAEHEALYGDYEAIVQEDYKREVLYKSCKGCCTNHGGIVYKIGDSFMEKILLINKTPDDIDCSTMICKDGTLLAGGCLDLCTISCEKQKEVAIQKAESIEAQKAINSEERSQQKKTCENCDNCVGCCNRHGGVSCDNDTLCEDGTERSERCQGLKCNKCWKQDQNSGADAE